MSYTLQLPVNGNKQKPPMKYTVQSVHELIQLKWPKLTDEEVNHYRVDPQKFYGAIKNVYNLSQEDIDLQLNIMKRKALYAAA